VIQTQGLNQQRRVMSSQTALEDLSELHLCGDLDLDGSGGADFTPVSELSVLVRAHGPDLESPPEDQGTVQRSCTDFLDTSLPRNQSRDPGHIVPQIHLGSVLLVVIDRTPVLPAPVEDASESVQGQSTGLAQRDRTNLLTHQRGDSSRDPTVVARTLVSPSPVSP